MFEKFRRLEKPQRLSRILGFLIGLGIFIIIIGILGSIRVTPYDIFTSPQKDFQIKYPSYWGVTHNPGVKGVGFGTVSFISPKQSELDMLQENVTILVKPVPAKVSSIEEFSKDTIRVINVIFKEHIKISQSSEIELGGLPAYRFTFSGREKPEISTLYSNAWVISGKKVYMITFLGAEKDYHLFKKKFDTMLKSFKFITPEQQSAQP